MVQFSQCLDCKNYIEKTEEGIFVCRAYPEGIPDRLFWNKVYHTEPVEGDGGIRYEALWDD